MHVGMSLMGAGSQQGQMEPVIEKEVFSHFRCSCGQCGMDDLKACTCQHPRGAKEVKAFVERRIAEGKLTVARLIREVDEKYGGRKN